MTPSSSSLKAAAIALAADMDILMTGRLLRKDIPEPPNEYILRDFGLLQCRKTAFSLSVARTTVSADDDESTITLFYQDRTDVHPLIFQVEDRPGFHNWETAFRAVTAPTRFRVTPCMFGSGAHAKVFVGVRNSDLRPVAVKVISRNNRPARAYSLSYLSKFLEKQAHNGGYPYGLVHCLAIHHTVNEVQSIMEAVGPTLQSRLKTGHTVQEPRAKSVALQLLCVLDMFHKRDIIHCGLTLSNIMVKSEQTGYYEVRLGGFSSATIFDQPTQKWVPFKTLDDFREGMQGNYISPELLKKSQLRTSQDFWSVGVIVYRLLLGLLPFRDTVVTDDSIAEARLMEYAELNETEDRRNFLFGRNDERGNALSANAKSFILMLLSPYPEERDVASNIVKHPWMMGATVPVKVRRQLPMGFAPNEGEVVFQ